MYQYTRAHFNRELVDKGIQILYYSYMASRIINISLPEELLKKIDKTAKSDYASRSDFIRETLVRRLKGQRIVDEWGDEGEWESVVDFRDINPDGVPVKEVLKVLQKITK